MFSLNSPRNAPPTPQVLYAQPRFYIPVPRGEDTLPGFPLAVVRANEYYDTSGSHLCVLEPKEFQERFPNVPRVVNAWENAEVHRNSNKPVSTAYFPDEYGGSAERVSVQRILFVPCEGPARILQREEYFQILESIKLRIEKRPREIIPAN